MRPWDKPRPPKVCRCGRPLTEHRDAWKLRNACPVSALGGVFIEAK